MKPLDQLSAGLLWEFRTRIEDVFSHVVASTEMLRVMVMPVEGPFEMDNAIHRTLFEEIHRGDVLNDV